MEHRISNLNLLSLQCDMTIIVDEPSCSIYIQRFNRVQNMSKKVINVHKDLIKEEVNSVEKENIHFIHS